MATLFVIFLAGCVGPAPDGGTAIVFNLAPSPCAQSQQYVRQLEATYKDALKLEVSGKLTVTELVKIRDTIYLLHSQSVQACNFFNRGRITFDQYKGEMREVREDMLQIEQMLASKEKSEAQSGRTQ